jgi:hypothetical protein
MQAHLREYVSFSAASSVFLSPGEEGVSVHGLPMAWLSEGIVFDETPVSNSVYPSSLFRAVEDVHSCRSLHYTLVHVKVM